MRGKFPLKSTTRLTSSGKQPKQRGVCVCVCVALIVRIILRFHHQHALKFSQMLTTKSQLARTDIEDF